MAAGGEETDIAPQLQQDMERLAYIRGLVAREYEKLKIRNADLTEENNELLRKLQHSEQHVQTRVDQLHETSEVIVQLNEQV
jgi:hypothetical protein